MSVLLERYPATFEDPRTLSVYQDKIVYGDFIVKCPIDSTFEDATVFKPGYKGMQKENMTIVCRNTSTSKVTELHVEIE